MKNVPKSKPLFILQCYEDRQQTFQQRNGEQSSAKTDNNHVSKKESTVKPPPPPPMPITNGHQNGDHKVTDSKKSVTKPITADTVTNSNFRKNGTVTRTPTPDYNKKTEPISQIKNIKDEKGELDSLESYKLKSPSNVQPKPPSNYFLKAPNGTATMKKHARPVSVTIGEYAYGGGSRREPTKLDFLNGDKTDSLLHHDPDDEVSISNRLQSELALTLSRSNLRKKTEALADASR